MASVEVTSLSSRGQVVIPQEIRSKLDMQEGEKFVVLGEDDTIILRRIKVPMDMDGLLRKTRGLVAKKHIKDSQVQDVVTRVRKHEDNS